jgi:hypothetical protein
MMVKNTSVLVLCVFLPVACHRTEQPASETPIAPNVQALTTQSPSVSPPIIERESVTPISAEPAPVPAPESIPVDHLPGEITSASNEWRSVFDQQFRVAMDNEVHRRGYKSIQDGMIQAIGSAKAEAKSVNELKGIAYVLFGADEELSVTQVVNGDTALVVGDGSNFLFRGKKGQLYEGSPLSAWSTVWEITGITSYQSHVGPKQAFTIRPVELFDIDDAQRELAFRSLIRADGSMSLADIRNSGLRECVDFAVAEKLVTEPSFKALTGLSKTCSEAFTRPPASVCDIPGKARFHGYTVHLGEEKCAKSGGTWSTTAASAAAQTAP